PPMPSTQRLKAHQCTAKTALTVLGEYLKPRFFSTNRGNQPNNPQSTTTIGAISMRNSFSEPPGAPTLMAITIQGNSHTSQSQTFHVIRLPSATFETGRFCVIGTGPEPS